MKPKWQRDSDGDYSLNLPSGARAWIANGGAGKSNPPWYGRVIGTTGIIMRVRGWTLASAKSAAEALLGIDRAT